MDVVEIKSKKPGRMNVTLIFANQTGGRWTDFLMSITSKGDGFNKAKKPSSNKFSSFSMTPTRLKWFDGEVLDKKSVKFKFSVTQNSDRKLTLAVLPTIKRAIDDTRETHAPLPTAVLLLASGFVGVLAVRRKWGR
jgi:hypothetical protein